MVHAPPERLHTRVLWRDGCRVLLWHKVMSASEHDLIWLSPQGCVTSLNDASGLDGALHGLGDSAAFQGYVPSCDTACIWQERRHA